MDRRRGLPHLRGFRRRFPLAFRAPLAVRRINLGAFAV